MIKLMDSGVPGAPGVAVLRPVEREVKQRLETVILLLQLMEESHVLGMKVSLKDVQMIHVTMVKVYNRCIFYNTSTNLHTSTVLL